MPHCTVMLQALDYLSFSFTFNDNKTTLEIHYNINNNILTSKHTINN